MRYSDQINQNGIKINAKKMHGQKFLCWIYYFTFKQDLICFEYIFTLQIVAYFKYAKALRIQMYSMYLSI